MEPPAPVTMHALAADAGAEQLRIRRHRIAPEQVADIHIAQLIDARLAGDDVGQIRQRLHVHAQRLERSEDLAPPPARGRRHGEQDALDRVSRISVRQLMRAEARAGR